MSAPLDSKRVLVTGVTSGIGEATTLRLLAAGARVIGIARSKEKLARAAQRFGRGFTPLEADLARPEDRRRAAEELGQLDSGLDVFVSNAAECVYESALTLPPSRLERLFEVNVTAVVELSQVVVPLLREGGHVVQLSSVTARFLPGPKFAPYAATKAAIEHFTQALRLELAPRGIRVSLIVPGLVDTPIYDALPDFARTRQKLVEQVPTWLRPDDVADAILWVVSRPTRVAVSELTLLPIQQTR